MSKKINLGPVTAYAIAVANGFTGTVKEWLESLRGEPGPKGDPGEKGEPGQQGDPGPAGVGVPDGGADGQILSNTADGPAWVDMPESGLPSGGTPYQQLVTDGSGNTQWEDRLAYEVTEEQVIFSQEDIAFSEGNGKYGAGPLDMPETISVGEKVRVDFDGETYDCIAYNDPLDSRHTVHIGNGFIIGLPYDTGEPFVILNPTGPTEIMIVTNLTNPSHTVSITKVVETVHKLPQKFLPDPTVFYYNEDGRLVDAEGVEMTLEQAKAVGLNFIIQSDSSVARPISALYGDDYVSFYVAEVINESTGTVALDNVYVGTPPLS